MAGRELARMICGACHVVTGDPKEIPILKPPAPSFQSIASRPAFSEESLRQLLAGKHARLGPKEGMPNPELADYQIDRIVAYFMTLTPEKK